MRPDPPSSFVKLRWRSRQHHSQPDGHGQAYPVYVCPYCGSPKQDGDKWGYVGGGGNPGQSLDPDNRVWWGWQDAGAMAVYIAHVDAGGDASYDTLCQPYEGTMIKCHWSRWGTWRCVQCGGVIWHDWGNPMEYYWRPPDPLPTAPRPPRLLTVTIDGAEYQQLSLM